jgi:hypothetical protein
VNAIAERRFANPADKPAVSASVFARAAWFLADYAELWWDCGFGAGDDADDEQRCNEMAELAGACASSMASGKPSARPA